VERGVEMRWKFDYNSVVFGNIDFLVTIDFEILFLRL